MTEERPELAEEARLEYLTYQQKATVPRVSERTVPSSEEEFDKAEFPLKHSDIAREVNKRIAGIVKGTSELEIDLDKDVFERIEEVKRLKQAEGLKQIAAREELRLQIGDVKQEEKLQIRDINSEHTVKLRVRENLEKIRKASFSDKI